MIVVLWSLSKIDITQECGSTFTFFVYPCQKDSSYTIVNHKENDCFSWQKKSSRLIPSDESSSNNICNICIAFFCNPTKADITSQLQRTIPSGDTPVCLISAMKVSRWVRVFLSLPKFAIDLFTQVLFWPGGRLSSCFSSIQNEIRRNFLDCKKSEASSGIRIRALLHQSFTLCLTRFPSCFVLFDKVFPRFNSRMNQSQSWWLLLYHVLKRLII